MIGSVTGIAIEIAIGIGEMAKRGGKAKDALVRIDPSHIRFTHSRIRPFFSGCGRRVEDTLADILDGRMQFEDLPFITVIAMDDGEVFFSLNNRRLWVIKQLKERGFLDKVPVRIKSAAEGRKLKEKYTVDRCSETAKFLYEVGAISKEREGAEGEEVEEGEEAEVDDAKATSKLTDEAKAASDDPTAHQKQHIARGLELQNEAPLITATAKPKRRADKKFRASQRNTNSQQQRKDSDSAIVLHVSSDLLGKQVDLSLEPHVCVGEFIR